MNIISGPQLRDLLPIEAVIACLREGYARHDALGITCPPRSFIYPEDGAAMFGSMPIYSAGYDKFVVKVASFHRQNLARGLPSIHGVVLVQDGENGRVEAIIDAATLTALRTAATSALVADLVAPASIATLAMLGTGAQAAQQLAAMLSVRTPALVRVYSRDSANVARFLEANAASLPPGCRMIAAASVAAAIDGAALICTATTCATPLFASAQVSPGAHISAVGRHSTDTREFPLDLLDHALLVVEEREAAIREAGAYNRQGVEIKELMAVARPLAPGRTSVYASVGTSFQDLCVAVRACAEWDRRSTSL